MAPRIGAARPHFTGLRALSDWEKIMRMNDANKGIVTPELMDVVETDLVLFGTATVGTVGTLQLPTYTVPAWVQDSVAGPLVVGLHTTGTDGNDTIYGTDRADDLFGLNGDDSLHGGAGNDTLDGGYGDDLLHGGAGADTLIGHGGWDTVSYAGSSAVTVNLETGGGLGGDAQGDILIDIAHVIGSSFDGVIIGSSGTWFNRLDGRDGNDTLMAGDGEDTLIGGRGFDTLTGGRGADLFVFTPGSQVDHITDFEHGDTIDLRAFGNPPFELDIFGFDGVLATGRIDLSDRLHSTQGLDPSDRVFFDRETMTLYQCSYVMTDIPFLGDAEYTLFLGDAIVSVDAADVFSLRTEDFLIA
jgi:hypothetical protein